MFRLEHETTNVQMSKKRVTAVIYYYITTEFHYVKRDSRLSAYVGVGIEVSYFCGGAVASWLVRSTPERALRVRALAGDIVLCS